MKKTVRDIGVKGKRVLVRCDFNVPMNGSYITDDVRIKAALPTIEYLMKNGAKVILMSHMGRPEGRAKMEYTLAPVAERLSILIDKKVTFISCPEVISERVRDAALKLGEGDVMLLENTRFRKEETKNLDTFSKELSELGDVFVNDAFGTAHRAHCSTAGISAYMPSVSGFLMEKEIGFLGDALEDPERPFLAIMGGAKVKDKIPVIENLLKKVDSLIIGGGMAYTFFKAMDFEIGKSILDSESIELARELMKKAEASGVKILLPEDVLCSEEFSEECRRGIYEKDSIPKDMMGMDIGPKTMELFTAEIGSARTVVWNGPMGVFEMDSFAEGTKTVSEAMAKSSALTIIGGGDSAAAVEKFGMAKEMDHISTGGGASLEFLEGRELPGIAVLEDK